MGRLPKFGFNLARDGDMLRMSGNATKVQATLYYWKKKGMEFKVQSREGNSILRGSDGLPYCVVTVLRELR